MICVQTIDGYLLIVDGGSVLCIRKLDTFVFPGPLAYIAHTDSIVIFSSDLLLECYSVRDLITMGSVRALTTENPVSISKVDLNTLGTSWSLQLGDVVKGVLSGRFLDSTDIHAVDIVIIGHQTIIVVSGYGEIKQTIPMEFIPHNWFPFLNKTEKIHTLLVVSKSGLFTIYKNLLSIWTIDCNEAQKAVAVGTFGQNTGMIVHLTKCGSLKISAIALWPFAFSFSNGLRAVNQNFKERNKVIKIDSSVSTQQFNVDMVFSKSQAAINYFTADQQKAIVSAQGLPFIVDVSIHQLHSCADDPYLVSIETPPCFLLSQTMFLIGYSEPQFKFAIVLASVLVPSLELCLTIHSKQAFALESHKFDIPLDICGCYSISSRIDNLKHSVLLHQLYKENNENKFAKFQFHWKASKNLSPLLSATVYKVLHSQFESFGHSGKIPKMLAPGSASKYSFSEEHLATTQELLQVSKQKIAYKIKTYQAIQGTLLHIPIQRNFCLYCLLCIINEHQQLYMAYIDILSGLATTKSLNDLKGLTIVC
ncbi:hypothetical protein BCR33DRAFT_717580 [Rhizoclosmatium globosum]|uniref:PTHB1 N-terminal domain-containing protein n=1 Tax=Rhizoclosmatium globosum TaxID=329046 RepID=A0A1Y2C8I9_9FUNG|nr:hypothetical protein BCR33DRAFT_717580 [Rhizoclosmatium globosum]|eukprot:ORY43351.1 hypothetical protein BCR33DRAFT_717580 [Rhizoclosmatium globosum]